MDDTLVIDTGEDIVGIYSVAEQQYTPYRGNRIAEALERIQRAAVVVTYNGKHADLIHLGRFAGLKNDAHFPINGKHVDMRTVCWSDEIWGSNLRSTYLKNFPSLPDVEDTYEGSNQLDTLMTLSLYQLWNWGQLRVVDGHEI